MIKTNDQTQDSKKFNATQGNKETRKTKKPCNHIYKLSRHTRIKECKTCKHITKES